MRATILWRGLGRIREERKEQRTIEIVSKEGRIRAAGHPVAHVFWGLISNHVYVA